MGQEIIKQPNGKFCIFNSMVDNVTVYDMEEQDIVNEFVERYKKETEKNVKDIISSLNSGGKPYHQFTTNYEDMINKIKIIHGKKEAEKIKKAIEK